MFLFCVVLLSLCKSTIIQRQNKINQVLSYRRVLFDISYNSLLECNQVRGTKSIRISPESLLAMTANYSVCQLFILNQKGLVYSLLPYLETKLFVVLLYNQLLAFRMLRLTLCRSVHALFH